MIAPVGRNVSAGRLRGARCFRRPVRDLPRTLLASLVLVFAAGAAVAAEAEAGAEVAAETEERVRVAASERYRAGRVHRFVLGGGYRDLWEAEIDLPILDLAVIGGGLKPTGRFGGLQTAVLGLKGADGRSYSFRGTDKDPAKVLDELLLDTVVETIVRDQMAAQHPGGPQASGVLTSAAGVITVVERMVVMPDDPRLGEYREEFAGMVGSFFEFPQPGGEGRKGFLGAVDIINHKELYERLARDHTTRVDVEAFLRARLLDILIGDFDRHRKQWRWAKIPDSTTWQPIPEDRDMAFVRYDGVAQRIVKLYIPILQNYGPDYPFIKGLTLHGWEQDRWLLPSLSWPVWEALVEDIQARLTDEVIDAAVAALPQEYIELDGERLRHDVRGRRDQLMAAARSYYDHLAREVDIQLTDAAEEVSVERDGAGGTLVEVRSRGEADPAEEGALVFSRTFDSSETKDLRIYLRDGDDSVVVRGGKGGSRLRVISGAGEKRVDDSAGGRTRVYDEGDHTVVTPGPGTRVDREVYTPPESNAGFVDVDDVPPRDWGSDTYPFPEIGYQNDVGVFLGAALAHTRYGFRKDPWSSKHSFGAGWATEANEPRLRYRGEFRPENSKLLGRVDLAYSGIEIMRFHGFGNGTSDSRGDSFYRVRNQQARAGVSVSAPVWGEHLRASAGPFFQFSRTKNGSRLIDQLNPYGNNHFSLTGVSGSLIFDTRRSLPNEHSKLEIPFSDNPASGFPTSGVYIDLTGRFVPPLFDVDEAYGSIEGSVAGYLSFGEAARLTFGARVGAKETFGDYPFFDAAYIGGGRFFSGSANNRGFPSRRFAGDTSLYGNLDARLFLARMKIIVPTDIGLQAFFDVGRVWFDNQDSNNWHPSGGGGFWLSPLVRTNTISFSVAQGNEDLQVYMRLGFHY